MPKANASLIRGVGYNVTAIASGFDQPCLPSTVLSILMIFGKLGSNDERIVQIRGAGAACRTTIHQAENSDPWSEHWVGRILSKPGIPGKIGRCSKGYTYPSFSVVEKGTVQG